MTIHKFKTNIKCGNCVKTVSPFLDRIKEIKTWEVDLNSPDRILSLEGEISDDQVIQAIQAAGYKAEKLN